MRLFRHICAFAAAVLPFLLSFTLAWAEEAEGGGKEGLPQFDPALFPEQIFWLVVSFAVLYVLTAYVALPRVAITQSNREKVISTEIESARTANNAAKASVAVTEKALLEARANAHAGVSEMLAKVSEEANERRAAQEKELSRKLHRAEADISSARATALEQIYATAEDLAKVVIDKILEAKRRGAA